MLFRVRRTAYPSGEGGPRLFASKEGTTSYAPPSRLNQTTSACCCPENRLHSGGEGVPAGLPATERGQPDG